MTYILGTKPIKIIFCNKWAKCQRSPHFPSVNLTFRYGWKIWKATPQRQNELSMYIVKLWDRRQSDNFELLCNKCDLQLNLAATYSIPLHHYNINTTLTSWWHTHTHTEGKLWVMMRNTNQVIYCHQPPVVHHTGVTEYQPIWQKQDIYWDIIVGLQPTISRKLFNKSKLFCYFL